MGFFFHLSKSKPYWKGSLKGEHKCPHFCVGILYTNARAKYITY